VSVFVRAFAAAARAVLALALVFAVWPALAQHKYRIVIIPKLVGIPYYDAVKVGIDAAARELPDVSVSWMGASQDQVDKQIDLIERVIPSHPDVLAVAANDPVAIAPALAKAQKAGIHVMSWDADSTRREFFVNLVDYGEFGSRLVDALADEVGGSGDIAIVTTSFTASNQIRWIDAIKRHIHAKHPGLHVLDIRPAGESTEEAYRVAQDYLKSYPSLKGIVALGAPNLPGVARAVRDAGRVGRVGRVAVIGNSTPNLMREYLKDGSVKSVLLWNPQDHGYLTVYSARELLKGAPGTTIQAGKPFFAGRLGWVRPRADALNAEVSLPVLVFTKSNVDQFRF
jgi:rhamnose transport system substrate-binding protein